MTFGARLRMTSEALATKTDFQYGQPRSDSLVGQPRDAHASEPQTRACKKPRQQHPLTTIPGTGHFYFHRQTTFVQTSWQISSLTL